jgi:ABC-type phosphate transport system substrate-binding protein
MIRSLLRHATVLVAGLVLLAAPAAAQEFKIVVNSANSVADLPADVVSKLFLKQAAKFPNGTAAVPVELPKTSAVRKAFNKKVHGRPDAAIESYWQQQIFSGKDVPPATRTSDDDVIAFVKENPGAIGYVSAGASTAGVKVVELK